MVKKLLIGFSGIALAVVSAAGSFTVQLYSASKLHGTDMKPGEYRLELKDDKAVFRQGKTSMEAPVKVETEAAKFNTTSVKYVDGAIHEIRLGGTNKRLVFEN